MPVDLAFQNNFENQINSQKRKKNSSKCKYIYHYIERETTLNAMFTIAQLALSNTNVHP